MSKKQDGFLTHGQKNILIGLLTLSLVATVVYYKVGEHIAQKRATAARQAVLIYQNSPKETSEGQRVALSDLSRRLHAIYPNTSLRPMQAAAGWREACSYAHFMVNNALAPDPGAPQSDWDDFNDYMMAVDYTLICIEAESSEEFIQTLD